MTFKLSVLDQSMTRSRNDGAQALQETIAMAQHCEQLGYHRFWVSEHHGFPALAGSAPEILIAALGAATKQIRLGSGGIMLPHYSAYKVAESFSVLANLYGNRIDLGVGRAPGTDMETARVLATDGKPKFERFGSLVGELSHFLWQDDCQPMVSPKPPQDLPIWMLGSSPDSAALAALRGLPYNLAAFINPQIQPEFIEYYKANFRPSALWKKPYCMLTISVFCAADEAYAKAMQLAFDVNFYRFITGQSEGRFLTPQEAQLYPMTPQLADFIRSRDGMRAVGTPTQVKAKIESIAKRFKVDEIMMVSNIYYFEDRKRSFELVKNAFSE